MEILHTILLGIVKYFWGQTVWLLDKGKHFALFQAQCHTMYVFHIRTYIKTIIILSTINI
jgi:hypothetical protein